MPKDEFTQQSYEKKTQNSLIPILSVDALDTKMK